MYRFNIKVDPDIVSDLCLNENTIIEAFFDDGNIIVRILDDEEAHEFPVTECEVCPFFCHVKGTCVIVENAHDFNLSPHTREKLHRHDITPENICRMFSGADEDDD